MEGSRVTLPPSRSRLTSMFTSTNRTSVPGVRTLYSMTTSMVVKMRFLSSRVTGLIPPPARATTRVESLAAAEKTPSTTRSCALQRNVRAEESRAGGEGTGGMGMWLLLKGYLPGRRAYAPARSVFEFLFQSIMSRAELKA